MKKVEATSFYEGMIFVTPRGVYREVTRQDIVGKEKIFVVPIQGLQYVEFEVAKRRITIFNPLFEIHDGVEYVRHDRGDGTEMLRITPTSTFTGADRVKGTCSDIVYVTPVTMAVYDPYTLCGSR